MFYLYIKCFSDRKIIKYLKCGSNKKFRINKFVNFLNIILVES